MSADADDEGWDWDAWFTQAIEDSLLKSASELTASQLTEFGKKLDEILPGVVAESSTGVAGVIVDGLKTHAPEMLSERRKFDADVQESLNRHWGQAFDLTSMTIRVAFEISEWFYKKHVPPDGVHDYVFEALGRLSARACRISEEVLVLLKSGFGQGGMARWRALHEVAVAATFISQNGEACAERYFAHEAVETWRGAVEFQKHAAAMGEEPYSDDEMAAMEAEYDDAIAKYGKTFGGHYGWAYDALRATDPRANADFPTIEKSVGMDFMRPYYRLASHPSHAKAKGITFDPDNSPAERGAVLLTGPSPAGLADPGYATVASLTQVVIALLTSKPGAAASMLCTVLQTLTDETGATYIEAHQMLEPGSQLELGSVETE